jgi:hypothetical protein
MVDTQRLVKRKGLASITIKAITDGQRVELWGNQKLFEQANENLSIE